jgi:cell division transport system permease protein
MLWVNIKRIIRSGFVHFWRNGLVTLASLLVRVVTLFVIGSLVFTSTILNSSLEQIKDKVDVNVYFATTAQEDDVLAIKSSLEELVEVQIVSYISREEALESFKKRHENDELTLQALEELGENPLGAVLNVRAKDPSQYETIASFLQGSNVLSQDGLPIVDKVNYNQNKVAIDKLSRLIDSGQKLGFIITIVFAAISVLITFNTIQLAIYTSREEIGVMRLVGASTTYIRGPFVVIGIMLGVIAGLITLALFYPITFWLEQATLNFAGINIFQYYVTNFGEIFAIIIGSGAIIGALSSFLAVRKHLNV